MDVYHINYSELESKYVGETPKNIRKAFECVARDDQGLGRPNKIYVYDLLKADNSNWLPKQFMLEKRGIQ